MTEPMNAEAVAQMVAELNAPNAYSQKSLDGYENDPIGFRNKLCASAADMLEALAAENATLRAEQAMLKFDIDKMLTQIEEHNAAWDELRASEAAAVARVKAALGIAKTRHIPDQPAAFGGSELEWAQGQYASLRREIIASLTPTTDKEPR